MILGLKKFAQDNVIVQKEADLKDLLKVNEKFNTCMTFFKHKKSIENPDQIVESHNLSSMFLDNKTSSTVIQITCPKKNEKFNFHKFIKDNQPLVTPRTPQKIAQSAP